jgi:general secretion pathway protein C
MREANIPHTLALLALLTVSAYLLADTVDALIGRGLDAAPQFAASLGHQRPAVSPRRGLSDYSTILERGFFGEGKAPTGSPAPAGSASYKLVGTVEGALFSGAVLAEGARQEFYRLGGKLPDGSAVVKVLRDRITLRRPDGAVVDVEVVDETKIVAARNARPAASAGVKQVSGNKFLVDQREVLASTENLSKVLMQARALPYAEQGKTVGFRLSEIVPGSIYAKIGLQNGDVIQRVNSQDISDPSKFFQLYQGLREERTIAIDLLRGGRRQTLHYEIR